MENFEARGLRKEFESFLGTPFVHTHTHTHTLSLCVFELGPSHTNEGLYKFIFVCLLLTSEKLEKIRKRKKDEEREVPDPRESIEETPTINFHPGSSKSDFREPSFDQKT